MEGHWIVHMKNNIDLNLDKKVTYVTTLDGTDLLVAFMTHEYGTTKAIVPVENIDWVEFVEEE